MTLREMKKKILFKISHTYKSKNKTNTGKISL